MTNIRDVARACGVSPMTVSFVLNNKAGQVSEQTRERVLQAMRELNYRPATSDRTPETRDILTLGVVLGIPGDSIVNSGYHGRLFQGIMATAERTSHNLMLFPHVALNTDPRRGIRLYYDGRCDGLIVIAPMDQDTLIPVLRERGIPFVAISNLGDVPGVLCVDVDNLRGAENAVAYLYAQGHRRIGFMSGPSFVRSAAQRRQGFDHALTQFHLPPDTEAAHENPYWTKDAYWHALEIARRPANARPTALFCWNDGVALNCLQAMHDAGVKVPEEISILGFDDEPETATTTPPLTTFRQPYADISRRAVEHLVAWIRDPSLPPKTEYRPAELVVRGSVAPPPYKK